MTREQATQVIRGGYSDYLVRCKDLHGKATFVCPRCRKQASGHGGVHSNGVGNLEVNNQYGAAPDTLHCFTCGFTGDIVDVYQEEYECSTGEAFRALYSIFGLQVDGIEDEELPPMATAPVQKGSDKVGDGQTVSFGICSGLEASKAGVDGGAGTGYAASDYTDR